MNHSSLLLLTGLLISLGLSTACSSREATPMDLLESALIPQPVSVEATGSSFLMMEKTHIYLQGDSDDLMQIALLLADQLRPATGLPLQIESTTETPDDGHIYLSLDADDEALGEEGYVLSITEDLVKLSANQPAGVFRGIQTLRQLLPASIESLDPQPGPWEIASGTIRDYPVYEYRGAMLDVARHFMPVSTVKRYIDLMAAFKFNVLHLHLSDDQGWRIEIKSWPKLATYGGSTEVGGGEGGYYTQDQYKNLIKYAQDRFITIVPEIDMPGHTNAALAAYPELYCPGKGRKPALYTGIEVGFSTLCLENEKTFQFVDDVIRELAEITPGPYLHIGGDESLATPMTDYIPFVNRVQDIVLKYNKKVIGWDEIAHADLKPGAVAQYWAEAENAKMAIDKGAKLIMSPAHKTYLDMKYDTTTLIGLFWAAYIEVDDAYKWEPTSMVEGISREHILGVETPLWSETIENLSDLEYMTFPRMMGHAEIAWTPNKLRNWENYRKRLGQFTERLSVMEINYYPSERVPWQKSAPSQ